MTYKRIFTFGCSYTEFIWPTWADIIGHDLNLPYENWGHAGTGNVYIAIKMLECDLKNKFTDTDLILVNWSSWHREDRMYPGGDIWASGGNVFNNEHYPVKFLKKYYSEYNDIVKNSTAIISSNKMFNINYQSHIIDYQGKSEGYKDGLYNFSKYQYYLDNLPKKNIFDNSDNSKFNNTVKDIHPDILTHLNHVQQVYKHLNLTINPSTVKKYSDMQYTIINTINNKTNGNILSALDWEQMKKFFNKFFKGAAW